MTALGHWFIDRLVVEQTHLGDRLPMIGDKGYVTVNLHTGEFDPEKIVASRATIQSSFSTSLRVSCDGHRVRVEGNPSRFGRVENLYGFTTFEECIQVYNIVLGKLGLPPFTTGSFYFTKDFHDDAANRKHKKRYTGAIIRHVDITRNHMVGYQNEFAFLRALATMSMPNGKRPNLYPNGATVDYSTSRSIGGSSWDYSKFYIKWLELVEHEKKNLKDASDEDKSYYKKLVEHCQAAGIVREEHSFKAKKLDRYELCFYGHVTIEDLATHHTLTTLENLTETLEVATMDYVTIADQLLRRQVCKSRQAANATANYCHMWLNGQPLYNEDTGKYPRQYYVHKQRLLQLGLDISMPFDASRTALPMIRHQREITVQPHQMPDWYRKPSTRNFVVIHGRAA